MSDKEFFDSLVNLARKSGFNSGLSAALKCIEPEIAGARDETRDAFARIIERISALKPPEKP